jgi:Spy/CpxP family protein refolding chaperone
MWYHAGRLPFFSPHSSFFHKFFKLYSHFWFILCFVKNLTKKGVSFMQRKIFSILFVVVALIAMTVTSVMAMGPGGPGKGMGPAFCGPRHGEWMRHLNLSPEQQEKILNIKQQFEKETLPIRQDLEKRRFELRQLWKADKPNQAALESKMHEMVPLKVTLRLKMRAMRDAIFNVLTPEQQKQLKDGFRRHKVPFGPDCSKGDLQEQDQ